jgi:hypothetical protein
MLNWVVGVEKTRLGALVKASPKTFEDLFKSIKQNGITVNEFQITLLIITILKGQG